MLPAALAPVVKVVCRLRVPPLFAPVKSRVFTPRVGFTLYPKRVPGYAPNITRLGNRLPGIFPGYPGKPRFPRFWSPRFVKTGLGAELDHPN